MSHITMACSGTVFVATRRDDDKWDVLCTDVVKGRKERRILNDKEVAKLTAEMIDIMTNMPGEDTYNFNPENN